MKDKLLNEFETYIGLEKKLSYNTIKSYNRDICKLFNYVNKKFTVSEFNLDWVNEKFFISYINYLKKEQYSNSTLSRTISSLNVFLEFLNFNNYINDVIVLNIKIDKKEDEEFIIFSKEEIYKILDIKTNSFNDYRDKAIFELTYAIGIKPTECINLKMYDVNIDVGYLKYKIKDTYRTVPLNNEAIVAIENYLEQVKLNDIKLNNFSKLFLTIEGQGLSRQGYWKIFKKRQQELGLTKELNSMTFRNSLAMHFLEDGVAADDVQELLGLKSLASLKQHYRKLQKKKNIKRVLTNHPRNSLNR